MNATKFWAVALVFGVVTWRGVAGDATVGGAVVGGALGATAGAIIGHQSHHGGEGALIGGAIGAVAGAITGSAIDSAKQVQTRNEGSSKTVVRSRTLTIADVKAMAAAGVSDSVIIEQIKATGSRFVLSADDIIDLHKSGVSDAVIQCMIETGKSKSASVSKPVDSGSSVCGKTETVVVPAVVKTQVIVPACPPPVVIMPRPRIIVHHHHPPYFHRVIASPQVAVGVYGVWSW